jgi:drug/metabolite transporter (DMT)-like permease
MHQQTKAYLSGGGAVLFWATSASAFKYTLCYLEPLQLVLLASIASAAVLFVVLVLQNKTQLLFNDLKNHWHICLGLGWLNPCLYYYVLFEAYDRLPAQDALAINYSWPVMLVLLSIVILKQRIRPVEFIAICLAYLGVVIIATHGNLLSLEFSDPLGVGFALGSTLVWALFWVVNVKQKHDPVRTLFLSFLTSLPVLILITWRVCPLSHLSVKGLAGATYIGFFEMGVTFVLWLTALKLSTVTAKVSSLAYLAPFLSMIVIHVVLGETIKPETLAGLALIITGTVMPAVCQRKEHHPSINL